MSLFNKPGVSVSTPVQGDGAIVSDAELNMPAPPIAPADADPYKVQPQPGTTGYAHSNPPDKGPDILKHTNWDKHEGSSAVIVDPLKVSPYPVGRPAKFAPEPEAMSNPRQEAYDKRHEVPPVDRGTTPHLDGVIL